MRRSKLKPAAALAFMLFAIFGIQQNASACALAPQVPLSVVDESPPSDVPPPEAPTISVEYLHRGKPKEVSAGEVSGDSCDDTGFFRLRIEPDTQKVGYLFNVRSGTLPDGYEFPEEPVMSNLGGPFWTDYWFDEATDQQESFEFELEVVAVDKWGRHSPPSNTLVVSDLGRAADGEVGCSSTGKVDSTSLSSLLAAWLLVGIHRRS